MDRTEFEERVLEVVPRLARRLNTLRIFSLHDLVQLEAPQYRRGVGFLHAAVRSISELRKTKRVEPVLGSKVLHHYFASLVPVFDTALIRRGVMRTTEFRRFVDMNDQWILFGDHKAAGDSALLEYHRYFAFVAAQIKTTPHAMLVRMRQRFGQEFCRLAPAGMAECRDSLVWKMDAKLAEYCVIGEAVREGLL